MKALNWETLRDIEYRGCTHSSLDGWVCRRPVMVLYLDMQAMSFGVCLRHVPPSASYSKLLTLGEIIEEVAQLQV